MRERERGGEGRGKGGEGEGMVDYIVCKTDSALQN